MNRSRTYGLLLLLTTLASPSLGAMYQFTPGTLPEGEKNALNVLGDGMFELSDTPNPAPNDFQYPALQSFDVEVAAYDGMGGSMPVVFSLRRASTTDAHFNLIFNNADHGNLLLQFDNSAITKGDPLPMAPVSDDDGIVNWNAPGLQPPSLSSQQLAGSLQDAILDVPEPTGLGVVWFATTAVVWIKRRRR